MEEKELIAFVQVNGYPTFTSRQLKRFREEKVVGVQVEHPGLGGTTSLYPAEAGPGTRCLQIVAGKPELSHGTLSLMA